MNEEARRAIRRLRERIADPAQKALVSDLLSMALIALQQFSELDETIYAYFAGGDISLTAEDELSAGLAEAVLAEVHAKTFRAIRKLGAFLRLKRLLGETDPPASGHDEFDFGEDFDLSFEDTGMSKTVPAMDLAAVDEFDIDKAFEMLADDMPDSTSMVQQFRHEVGMLGRVLVQEIDAFDTRINTALDKRQYDLALRELDASRQALGEGLFALVSTTFEVFGEHIERADILPAYKGALEQSLLLRSGLADLTNRVAAENDWVIQDATVGDDDVREAIDTVASILEEFGRGELCHAMRAPDRLELEGFVKKLRKPSLAEARLACEGLAKYLESLSIINQREVLVEHDRQIMDDLRESLGAARSLYLVSPGAAAQMVREALDAADKLHGRNPALDEQIATWRENPSALENPETAEAVIAEFESMLR